MKKVRGNKRIGYIDYIRAFAIVLMIVGHIIQEDARLLMPIHEIIYSFHIPLFFFISGYVFSDNNLKLSTKEYIKKNIKQIMFPYLGYCCLYLLLGLCHS